jgi:hypothetical protein
MAVNQNYMKKILETFNFAAVLKRYLLISVQQAVIITVMLILRKIRKNENEAVTSEDKRANQYFCQFIEQKKTC